MLISPTEEGQEIQVGQGIQEEQSTAEVLVAMGVVAGAPLGAQEMLGVIVAGVRLTAQHKNLRRFFR